MLRKPDSISKQDKIIEDPIMEPFFLTQSKVGGFAVHKRVIKGENNTEYIQTLAYPSNFNSALRLVSKELLNTSKKTHYKSIKEYISSWNQVKNKMETLTDLG